MGQMGRTNEYLLLNKDRPMLIFRFAGHPEIEISPRRLELLSAMLIARKVAFGQNKAAFERSISKIRPNTPTKDKVPALFDCFEYERAFSRSDLIQMFRSVTREVTDTRKVAITPVYLAIDIKK